MNEHPFLQNLRSRKSTKRIGLPDALDERALQAALLLQNEQSAIPVLIGNHQKISQFAEQKQLDISLVECIDPAEYITEQHIQELYEKRRKKGMRIEQAAALLREDSVYAAGIMLQDGFIDGCVAGNISTTGHVLRAGISTVGLAPQMSVVSSYFLMLLPNGQSLCYADCGVVPDPDAIQLCDIAGAAAANYGRLTGETARVAFLSFSTKGSARHPRTQKVIDAYALFKEKFPHIAADGELQADAALIPAIARRKAPDSAVAGQSTVLIFPDLDSGNIAYKLTERLAGAIALGPIIQGLSLPFCDLSRGCTARDIADVSIICTAM